MFDILHNWFVIQGVNEGVPYFWSTPIGASSVMLIMVCALIKIFKANLDLVTSIYNWVLVGVCAISMLHVAENSNPRHQMMVLVLALAVKKAWDVYNLFRKGRK